MFRASRGIVTALLEQIRTDPYGRTVPPGACEGLESARCSPKEEEDAVLKSHETPLDTQTRDLHEIFE